MIKKDLTIKLNIALVQIPEECIPELVERIQIASVAIVSEYTFNVQAEKIVDERNKNK